ncbi:ATP-binding protein [Desulfofustis glycolicus]|uniref:4Fe-4S dicluster domain-containing protein n=1 Tax=Desulfofustis glycolicus DSM 9705 TaxID=1121409 RepID=A0A1M5WTX7_9BACT|nr:4Fe-4S binding protein [Desulfofustis glycolicus]MCB2218297.1 4Fe-4S binding protein [Desulfobulbaceae bacterium]SHH90443.1 4Fe-4S dicluster domain-containing protein [Desulfofustis glycolicus DSM 9705]
MFIKPSTRRLFREFANLDRYGWGVRLHGYVYGRWLYQYIAIGTGEHRLVKAARPLLRLLRRLRKNRRDAPPSTPPPGTIRFADTYHGKVVTLDAARKLVTLNQPLSLPNLEKVVPYQRARDIILENPDHLAVLQCPCRSARRQPCLPLEVCLVVGEPFVGFIVDHHPHKARRIDSGEAVAILEAENRRGHVAHAFFKDAMLDRFYAICNCCSCCCGAMQAQRHGTPMLAPSGYSVRFAETQCIGCGQCGDVCQFAAIIFDEKPLIDLERCMGCGVCVSACPEEALTLQRDPGKGEPLEIHRLMAEAASREEGQ